MTHKPPIFIVSLSRATHRREAVAAAFRSVGLPFEFADAVDGRAPTPEQRARYSHWRALFEMGRPLSHGMFGASLSHLGVYERMVAENLPVAAVFEDDVEPSTDLGLILESISHLPEDWQVVTLHSLFPSSMPRSTAAPPIAPGRVVCTYERVPFGTQGYLINLSGAQRVLDVAYPVAFPPDEILFRRHPAGLRVYGIEPSPLVHREIASEIHAQPAPLVPDHRLRRPIDRTVVLAGKLHLRASMGFAAIRTRRPPRES